MGIDFSWFWGKPACLLPRTQVICAIWCVSGDRGNELRTHSRKSHQLEQMVTILQWKPLEVNWRDLISFFRGTLKNYISRQMKLSLQEQLKAAALGRGGKMKTRPAYTLRPSSASGSGGSWPWPAPFQSPTALGFWSPSFHPGVGRLCWHCCYNKGCCMVRIFSLFHPGGCQLYRAYS